MSRGALRAPGTEAEIAPSEQATRLYYGWIMLPLSMMAMIASSPGQTFGVSIFNESMRRSLTLTHGQLASAYMLGTMLGAVPIAYFGYLMDRHGLRRTMLIVVTLFTLACLATSQAQGWLTLTASFCLLRMLGPGALSFLSGNTLAFWFERRLGTVEGLRQLGMACSMAVIPALNLWLVGQWGWRGAYMVLGASVWLVLFPVFFLLFRNRPSDLGQTLDGDAPSSLVSAESSTSIDWLGMTLGETIRTRAFWIVTGGTALFGLIHTAVFFCIVPIYQERGLTEHVAAGTMTVFAVGLAAMQLIGGILADRYRAPGLLAAGLGGLALAMSLLYFASTPLTAQLAGGLLGASQGLFFGVTHPLWARYFGRRHLGKIRGVLMTIVVSSSSFGPLFAGLMKDWLGDFNLALLAFTLAPMPMAILSLFAAAPHQSAESPVPETLELATVDSL